MFVGKLNFFSLLLLLLIMGNKGNNHHKDKGESLKDLRRDTYIGYTFIPLLQDPKPLRRTLVQLLMKKLTAVYTKKIQLDH